MKTNQIRFLKAASQVVPPRFRSLLATKAFYVISLFYGGDQVVCPCCEGQFRTFLPSISGKANEVCPRCLTLPRHRLLWLYLQQRTNLFTDRLKLLHIAPELAYYNRLRKRRNLDYLSADLDSPLAMVEMDITAIQYPDDTFDAILCNHVLEHIPDDRQAMRELWRVLKPGGWAIVQSPLDATRQETLEDPAINTPEQRQAHYWHYDHKRLYGLDYKDRLAAAGFAVQVRRFVNELEPELIERYRLHADEAIYYCVKPARVGD